jgi:hypothetical protein
VNDGENWKKPFVEPVGGSPCGRMLAGFRLAFASWGSLPQETEPLRAMARSDQ